jgi:predicted permease
VIEPRDVGAGAVPSVVLTHRLWQRSFGGDSGVVGREIRLNGEPRLVVGVLPAAFVSPDRDPDVWSPLDLSAVQRDPAAAYGMKAFRAVGRLEDGVTPARVAAALDRVAQRLRLENPAAQDVASPNVVALRDDMVGSVRPILLVVMGAAGLVLVLCCVNVAELFLSRATARRRELAIRSALGAGRARLVRQLLTESAVLALLGGTAGVALAFWWQRIFVDVLALLLPSVRDVPIDAPVLAFAVVVSLVSALAFGIAPALAGTRADPQKALGESARGAAGGRARTRTSSVLVAVQFALAALLLIGAGLLGRTMLALERTGVGFDTGRELLTFRLNLVSDAYADPDRRIAFFDTYLERVRALPGVRAAAVIGVSPWSGYTSFGLDSLFVDGEPPAPAVRLASRVVVSEDWFATLSIPLRRGRTFTAADAHGAQRVAVVSESLAHARWPGADAVGRRLRIGSRDADVLEVVGVVGDVRARPAQDVRPTVYVPMRQSALGGGEFVVRAGRGLALVPAIERALRAVDPTLPVAAPRALDEIFDGMLAGQRLPLMFTGAFALLALALAVLGVYSVLAYSVAARRRELGIRVALGARRGSVLVLVLRQGMTLALAGTAAGVLSAALATRALAGLLVGVTPHDAATFALVPAVLLAVSGVACLIPARRSLGIQPVEALRTE